MQAESHPGRMLLQIHDELLFESPESEVEALATLARQEMESALDLNVPIVAEPHIADNWCDAK